MASLSFTPTVESMGTTKKQASYGIRVTRPSSCIHTQNEKNGRLVPEEADGQLVAYGLGLGDIPLTTELWILRPAELLELLLLHSKDNQAIKSWALIDLRHRETDGTFYNDPVSIKGALHWPVCTNHTLTEEQVRGLGRDRAQLLKDYQLPFRPDQESIDFPDEIPYHYIFPESIAPLRSHPAWSAALHPANSVQNALGRVHNDPTVHNVVFFDTQCDTAAESIARAYAALGAPWKNKRTYVLEGGIEKFTKEVVDWYARGPGAAGLSDRQRLELSIWGAERKLYTDRGDAILPPPKNLNHLLVSWPFEETEDQRTEPSPPMHEELKQIHHGGAGEEEKQSASPPHLGLSEGPPSQANRA